MVLLSCPHGKLQKDALTKQPDPPSSRLTKRVPSNLQAAIKLSVKMGIQWKLLLKMPLKGETYVSVRKDNQTKKWAAGELQPQQQEGSKPHAQPWETSLGAVPSSNSWVTAFCLTSWNNCPRVEASSEHGLKIPSKKPTSRSIISEGLYRVILLL